jgi:hypothetical protein
MNKTEQDIMELVDRMITRMDGMIEKIDRISSMIDEMKTEIDNRSSKKMSDGCVASMKENKVWNTTGPR